MTDLIEAAEHVRRYDVYLHKTTGERYSLVYSVAGLNELHPIQGSCRYVSDDDLKNSEIWSRV